MPRTSLEGLERAKKTADKYINRSGGTPYTDQTHGQVRRPDKKVWNSPLKRPKSELKRRKSTS